MEITVKRKFFGDTYTIGDLYVDGEKFCNTLEDKVRPDGVKVFGETAIPYGSYNVTITMSNRFKKLMPLVENVKGFDGIRIHSGNTDADTHGCLLVGVNSIKGQITNSRVIFEKLNTLIAIALKSNEKVILNIKKNE